MKVLLEYIWIDGSINVRSKTRIIDFNGSEIRIEDIPVWNYDGSSTGQANGRESEIYLKPVKYYKNPFYELESLLVLCETYTAYELKRPTHTNRRVWALDIFNRYQSQKPWYGIEQEYFIWDPKLDKPMGWSTVKDGQGKYYCSVGGDRAFGRQIADEHMMMCLKAGIKICGTNAEVAPGQWEYQIGPLDGVEAADQLWVSRFILNKVAEKYEMGINYHPKPLREGDWNGSGCHTNFSTEEMRRENGLVKIIESLNKLEKRHSYHMNFYGEHNSLRMTGKHETANYHIFTYGMGHRGASVRLSNQVMLDKCGYFEDRRPASNCDPYLVTGLLLETINKSDSDMDTDVSELLGKTNVIV